LKRELDLTESEIIAALQRARENPILDGDPPGAMTITDIADSLGLATKTARRWVKILKKRGFRFEKVQVVRRNIWDEPYTTNALILTSGDDSE